MVLEQLARFDGTLSELLQPMQRYANSGEINTRVSDAAAVVAAVSAHYSDANTDDLDGLTVDHGDWWFNLRASNTEPLLRLNLEASTAEEVSRRVAEVQAVMAEVG
jgi:phosphomannomutase